MGLAQSTLGDQLAVAESRLDTRIASSPAALIDEAFAARPDIRGTEIAIEAAGDRLGWEKAKVLQLFARLDLKPSGTRGGSPSLLLPGAQLEIPIFNWNPGGRGRAEAEMTQAVYRYVATRDDVAADVRTAHAQLELAIASLLSWRENVLPLLAANVTTALKAYEVGAYVRSERCRVSRQKSARSSCSLRSKA